MSERILGMGMTEGKDMKWAGEDRATEQTNFENRQQIENKKENHRQRYRRTRKEAYRAGFRTGEDWHRYNMWYSYALE